MVVRGKREIVINSDFMKIVVASYYRFKLHYIYTCTEFDFMDVCACNGNSLIEIECKISKSDLKKELDKPKHKYYKVGNLSYFFIPNKYYIAITQKMYEDKECVEFIKNLNPNYGIIVISDWREPHFMLEAKKLHKEKVTRKTIDNIILRATSENIGLRKKLYDLKNKKSTE